ncbi:PAAR domain-containing protein [Aquabacterium sp. UBA2148]|uniref:PAAR domain-containing protein n=1 Tax=Aquabacterium sp. UBA2148 TaxID=1946042 RepID=UPI0032E511EC
MHRHVWYRHVTLRQVTSACATLLLLDSCPINDQAERNNMATLPFVVLGDRTTHGGSVISADYTFDVHGKYVARVGDMTVCPRCKGTFPIVSGSPDMSSMGQSPARHGDKQHVARR